LPNALPRFLAPLLILAAHLGLLVSNAFAAAPFPMSSGNYAEGFDDITNWTNSFASGVGAQYWSSVPVNSSGTIPNGVKTSASTATFVSGTTEGVQKGSGNIQLLATNGTDNTHAVAIDLLLDFTGMNAGTLSYDFATVFNPSGNRNGSLRVYTSTDGVTFTELTDASVVDFQNNVAFSKQVQLVPLPAAFTNSATARIRFYDYNGTGPPSSTGARPKASIDNVVVTGTPIGAGAPSGPAVSNFSIIPAAPVDTLGVTVQASVVDTARALDAVSLAWGASVSSLPNVIGMAPASGDFWQTASPIPAQAGGTVVYYQVTAADDSVTVQSPVLHYTVAGTGSGSTSAPVITSVYQASDSTLEVFFSVPVDSATSQTPGNYSVNGIVAVDAVREPGATKQVMITVRSIPPGDRTLTANGVGDLAAHYTNNATFVFHFVDVSVPAGYYDGAIGLRGSALLIALHHIIKGHTALSYSFTATAFHHTDKRPDGKVWDVYSDIPGGTPPYEFDFGPLASGGSESIAYNREHSFPQSWFGGSNLPMYSDLWIIYPTDSKVNNERGNWPYGQVGTATWTSLNGSKLGNCVSPGSYSGTCFEPIDGYKGDLARSQFYVATRYFGEDASWPGGAATSKSQLLPWAADQYLQWSIADAVSWKERARNAAIYEYQHNRNPFVDHPEFVSAIYDSNNVTGVHGAEPPRLVMLRAAMPNPFQARTVLVYDLPRRGAVALRIYDVSGRLVRSLESGAVQEAGRHAVEWDGRDDAGTATTAGLYFGRLEAGGESAVRRLVRVR
jgi:endonuclease I